MDAEITVRLDVALKLRLKELAAGEGRSLASFVRRVLADRVTWADSVTNTDNDVAD